MANHKKNHGRSGVSGRADGGEGVATMAPPAPPRTITVPPTGRGRGEHYRRRTRLIHGSFATGKWDYDHHVVPPESRSATFRLSSVHRGAEGFEEFGSPVRARADVSVAMGSAAALGQARADIVVLSDRIDEVAGALDLARRTMAVVRQNLRWAVIYNVASVPLALAGWLPPWLAGLGMALSSLVVVLNALRLTRRRATDHPAAAAASDRPAVAHGA